MFVGNSSRRVVFAVGLFYGLLLVVSCVVRDRYRPTEATEPTEHSADVWAVDRGRVTPARVRIAYREFAPGASGDVETIVLLHGSPGRKEDFESLATILARDARVLVPDLPGFGSSTTTLPDYSFRAHALYVRELMDDLDVRRAHVVGFSMGGGVALSLIDLASGRVASLTMLSAIGVQEMELTGDYYVNHFVHGVQLAALWMARDAAPHMGVLDGAIYGVPYARNFFESDQRPLRGVLQHINVPTLIVHGTDDTRVPIEAAREHYRLVPQSYLVTLEGDHRLLSTRAPAVGHLIAEFVHHVADRRAPDRGEADPARVRAAALPFDPKLPRVRGIAAAVFTGVLTAAALVAENVTAVAAGIFLARGRASLMVAITGCLIGVFVATVIQRLRRLAGRKTLQRLPAEWFVSPIRITLLIGVAATVSWVVFRLTPMPSTPSFLGIAVAATTVVSVWKVGRAAATERGRRLLVSTWRRCTRWEFWPPWVFYPPVLAYLAYLMVKHRSATLFTAANPAILAGGFVGESKYDILQGLSSAGEYVARSALLEGTLSTAEKMREARRFMGHHGLTFPIVLKPNYGQRGSGVVVVRSTGVLEDCLERSTVDTIVQEYVGGAEFGIFYYRRPSERHGRIFSVTEKKFPSVVGDGHRTLEQLILHDERAVCAARLYCERHRDKLSSVPADGEAFPLVELGTHCRGAMFLDGGRVLTRALEERFDTIARGFDGFYFGRFDIRVDGGAESFRAGRGFKIIELNGVTSEATHIYHPGTPLLRAYRVLMTQWRIAFEIGAENRRSGVDPTPLRKLVELVSEYRRTARQHLGEWQNAPLTAVPDLRVPSLSV